MKAPRELFEEATNRKKALVKKHERHLAPIAEAYKGKYNRNISPYLLESTAQILENAEEWVQKQKSINESTYSDAVAYVNYGFKVISALMPSLIAQDIVSVQPMDRRTGQIFYLSYLAGTTKGEITATDVLIAAKTGSLGNKNYASDTVANETIATGNGSTSLYTTVSLAYNTLRAGSVVIVATLSDDSVETFTDDGANNLVSDLSPGAGTVNYTAGTVTIQFSGNVKSGAAILATYRVDQERNTGAIPEMDLDLLSETVTAKTRKLRAKWLLDAAYDLQKAHGITAESELLVAVTSEVKNEIDVEITDALLALGDASGNTATFDGRLPTVGSSGTVFPWVWQKEGLLRTFASASQAIFNTTRRGVGNFVICSPDVAALISTMDGFKADVDLAAQPPSGPYRMGSVNGLYSIYNSPYYASGRFVVGFKGDSFLNSGYCYAPYLPIFVTPTIILDDFVYRRGIATAYATKAINGYMYVGGTVSNL